MAEGFFRATRIRLRVLLGMVRPFRRAYARLAVLFLLSPLIESFNISLMIPLFGLMLGGGAEQISLPRGLEAALAPFVALPLGVVCLLFVALAFLRGAASYLMYVQNERLSHKVREFWMNRIFDNYVHGDYAAVARAPGGQLASNVLQDTDAGRQSLTQLMTLLSSAVSILIYFALLLLLSWRITVVFSVAAIVFAVLVSRFSTERLLGLGRQRIRAVRAALQTINEALRGLREIKAFSHEAWIAERLRGQLRDMTRAQTRQSLLVHVPRHVQDVFIVVVFIGAIYLASRVAGSRIGEFFPTLIAFTFTAIRLVRLLDQILTTQLKVLYNLPALRSVQAEMDSPRVRRRQTGTRKIDRVESDIAIENVCFSYDAERPALQGISLVIPRRGMTALVGPSGCGKSTLADLLLRLYDPDEGRVVVNGMDLREIDPSAWRDRIGFVAQDGFVFSGTIRENIVMGSAGASNDAIAEAARLANAWEFIRDLPDGLDTVIGEQGVGLSGGQRQRVRIARAVLRQPDLLIFDEATSALDAQSERMIRKAIEAISARTATVVIAHRLSLIERAGQIVVLESGRVQAIGDYGALMADNALFRSLSNEDDGGRPALESAPD